MRRAFLLTWLPMALGSAGAWLDERRALGLTIWRGACRASGLSLQSVVTFTLELLPTAVIGVLLGGLLVLFSGLRARTTCARDALAAHAGCLLAMPMGLLLCASALPWPLMLVADAACAALIAAGALWLTRIRKPTYANPPRRGMTRIPRADAATDNFSRHSSMDSA